MARSLARGLTSSGQTLNPTGTVLPGDLLALLPDWGLRRSVNFGGISLGGKALQKKNKTKNKTQKTKADKAARQTFCSYYKFVSRARLDGKKGERSVKLL